MLPLSLFFPSAFFPPFDPAFGLGIHQVSGVGVESDFARFLENFETGDSGEQLHPIVSRFLEPLTKLLLMFSVPDDSAEATRAWVAARRTVCVDKNLLHVANWEEINSEISAISSWGKRRSLFSKCFFLSRLSGNFPASRSQT